LDMLLLLLLLLLLHRKILSYKLGSSGTQA
jgi:hypothetical protein